MNKDFYSECWIADKKLIEERLRNVSEKGNKREIKIAKNIFPLLVNDLLSKYDDPFLIKELILFEKYYNNDKNIKEDINLLYKTVIFTQSKDSDIQFNFNKILNNFKQTNSNVLLNSIFFNIVFSLQTSYISKDDDPFYIIDNPIVKEKVFKIPMVRPSTWKGSLRHSAITIFEEEFTEPDWKQKRAVLVRLFGSEKEILTKYLNRLIADKFKKDIQQIDEEFKEFLLKKGYISEKVESRAGRLTFYPTFFNSMSLDVMTPLDRATKTPDNGPIYFEVVPADEKGDFKLMYYPFDLVVEFSGQELETKIRDEQKDDMDLLGKALTRMFYQTGFSAKKTSGYGLAKPIEKKNIQITGFDGDAKEKLLQVLCGI